MKDLLKIAFGVVCGLLGAGVILLVGQQPRGQGIALIPPPTPLPLKVHVVGAVVHPGVYELPANSRGEEAIQAAGGFLPEADMEAVNLAAFLEDGELLRVPTLQPTPTAVELTPTLRSIEIPLEPSPTATKGLININTATQAELESLPGIGPVLAQRIIAYREKYGPFKTIEDLIKVNGIGPKTFALIKNLITV